MPWERLIEAESRIIIVRVEEPFSTDDAMRYLKQAADHRSSEFAAFGELLDLCQITSSDIRYTDLEYIIRQIRPLLQNWGSAPVALLVGNPMVYGLGRMCQSIASDLPIPIGVFCDEGEARYFLANPDTAPRVGALPPLFKHRDDPNGVH